MRKLHNEDDMMIIPSMMGYQSSYIELSRDRSIFLSENVTKESAAQLSALLLYYDNDDHNADISLYINSNGGDADGTANIYDVMQMISAPVKTICLGKCYSAGAILLASGSKGKRFALKSSKIMLHGIQFGFPLPGQDIITSKNYYQYVKDNNDNIMKILSHHTGHPLEKIKEDCKQDFYMSAGEALKYGVIDAIL